ncbi:MAG TPA: MATE family efflux transporter [Clostridiales bacterium]|mgnify:FL=1|nr:MATE family efflux transporter [Clostridiales bacterium]HQD30799.1 MATE family efflux transporter [Clostridiales bacterium]
MQDRTALTRSSWIFGDRGFRKRFLSIAIPVTLQQFLTSSLNLTNNILVGQLGDASVAAVGLANQVYFILNVVLLGIGGGISVYISQFWGSRKYDQIKKVVSLSMIITMTAALIFFIPSFAAPGFILSLFSKDMSVIGLGSEYLRPVSISFLLMTFSICFSSALRSTGNVRLPLVANFVGIVVNTVLNYVLIFGKLGLPAMGVAGSAIATVVARLMESLIILWAVYASNNIVSIKPKDLFNISADLIKRFFSTSGELIAKDVVWATGTSIYMVIYALMSTEAAAAVNITSTIRSMTFVFFQGVSNACLIMVGNKIGENDNDTAYEYALRFLRITLVISAAVGCILIFSRPLVLAPYKVSQTVIDNAMGLLVVAAVIVPFQSFASVAIVGAMRGGGDIRYTIFLDLAAVWFIGMPLAWLGGLVLHLDIVWVFLLVSLQEVFKAVLCYWRIRSKKWINNVVHGI